jgi:CDGSH-type Zn-finger protein
MTAPTHGNAPICVHETPGKKSYCACGWSEKLPYCDGAHKRLDTGLHSIKVELTEPGEKLICQCHQSKTMPWCDGTHKTLRPPDAADPT